MVDNYGMRIRSVANANESKKETKEDLYSIIDRGLHTLQTNRAALIVEHERLVHASRDPAQNTPDWFARNVMRMEQVSKLLR